MDRIYRVSDGGQPFYAVERDGQLRRATFASGHFGADYTVGDVVDGGLQAVRVLAPVRPSKMVCVGQNYLDHIAELKKTVPAEPVLFLKPPSTLLEVRVPGRQILPGATFAHPPAPWLRQLAAARTDVERAQADPPTLARRHRAGQQRLTRACRNRPPAGSRPDR